MQTFPWLKYFVSILSITVVVALMAKFVTSNAFILIALAIGGYRILVYLYIKPTGGENL